MTHRILPARWGQEVVDLDYNGFSYRVAVSWLAGGSPAAVSIDSAKVGSTLDTYGHDVAVLVTTLLQSGVDMSTIEQALAHKADTGLAARVVRLIGGAA
jgi:hypothetical protein